MERRGDWIQLASGRAFYPLDPRGEDICILDIAHALARTCRFGGHCNPAYYVASHSVFVSRIVPPQDALWGLLHDASEAYLCDLPRPIKAMPEFAEYRKLEANIMRVICGVYGLAPEMPESVRKADSVALATEARDLMAPPRIAWKLPEAPLLETVIAVDSRTAQKQFLDRYSELVAARSGKFDHG